MREALIAILLFAAVPSYAQLQPPFLLKELAGGGADSSNPLAFTQLGGEALFFASDPVHGSELWKTDGTPAGTIMLRDIVPGVRDGRLTTPTIVVSGARAFFVSARGSDLELWKTDGTPEGTTYVAEICTGCGVDVSIQMVDVAGTLFFTGSDSTNGWELWRSDGTAAGTFVIEDIFPGTGGSDPDWLENRNGTLFFAASDGVNGRELWKSDGTAPGTEMVLDINPGPGSSSPEGITALGGVVYINAQSTAGSGIWQSDGSAGGTIYIAGLSASAPGDRRRYFFQTSGAVAFFRGDRLYGLQGDVVELLRDPVDDIRGATVLDGQLLFSSEGQLWQSDGVTAGELLTINPDESASISSLTTAGSRAFFTASDPIHGEELWKTDGTAGGTSMVRDIGPGASSGGPSSLTAFGSNLVFSASLGGTEPWLSDGTAGGTLLLKDVNPNVGSAGLRAFHAGAGGALIRQSFAISATNGTTPGTNPLGTARFPFLGSDGIFIDGTYFFTASDDNVGTELWKSDGTPAGTVMVKDICPGWCESYPGSFASLNGTLYFSAFNATEEEIDGRELWRSDGTAAGTVRVKDLAPRGAEGDPRLLTVSGGKLFFVANDGVNGTVLWMSDGTQAGTVPVTGGGLPPSPDPSRLTDVGGTLFFFAYHDPSSQYGLFKTDGSTVEHLEEVGLDGGGRHLVSLNGMAIFNLADGSGYDVWKSDGTVEGTVEVSDNNFPAFTFVPASSSAFFTVDDGVAGVELWRTDGITTQLVKDICPGPCSPQIQSLVAAGPFVYFQARDGDAGEELWRSDGSAIGTVRVADLAPGTGGSSPTLLTPSGNRVYFSARTLTSGEEPWVACTTAATALSAASSPTVVAGAIGTVAVTARDTAAADVPCYAGTVHFTSSDPVATLPSNYTFIGGEGPHAFSFSLGTLGSQTITVTDTVTGSMTATFNVTVGASPVTSTITASPVTVIANGTSTSQITVRYKDANGNNLPTGGGTLTLSTNRGTISAPVDQGNGTYRATLTSSIVVGPATISGVLNGTAMTNTATVQFVAGPAVTFDISTPATVTANAPFSVTVSALDTNGNTADAYGGTIHFAVNDTGPSLPPDYTFQPLDAGVRVFNGVVLKTVGNRTMTVTDTVTGSISGVALVPVKGATTTAVTSNVSPAGPGANVTFTATVTTTALGGPPPGSVTFKDGTVTLGSASLSSGTATLSTNTLSRRPHAITAVYEGSTNFFTSTSNVFTQYVTLAAPAMSATFATAPSGISVTWSADAFATTCEIWRRSHNGALAPIATVAGSALAYLDSGISPGTTYHYRVRFFDSGNNPGDFTFVDLATTISLAGDPLPPGTSIKAIHPQQMRQVIDAVRASVGLGAAAYTNAVLAAGGPIRAIDWSEMRSRLDEARALIPNLKPVPGYTDPSITIGTRVKGAHLTELRIRAQ